MPDFPHYAVKTLVPDAVYTDRQEFIDYFYQYALDAIERRAMSSVLLGKRRMGKTEIFKRVVNRLFFEQDHVDPKAAVPVYYSFRETPLDRWEFASEYVENFLRWYAAFRLRNPSLLNEKTLPRHEMASFFATHVPMTAQMKDTCRLLDLLENHGVTIPENTALTLPREISDGDDSTIVMFLDEFQNTRLPHNHFDIVGFLQEAVESPTCPHFVTGSAMTMLAKEVLGRGALFGRFRNQPIEEFTPYWGAELALRAARYYHADLPEIMAPVVAQRCGGNPFYITAVMQQAAQQGKPLADEETINKLLAVALSSGFIWAELHDQVMRWIGRINQYGVTKWVLYLSALEEGERIEPERIQQQLYAKDGQQVDLATIRDVLIHLSRGDLLEYMQLGGWFRKVDDPILLDFLKAWGQFEVEGQRQANVITETIKRYDSLKRQIADLKGYLAEVYLAQSLLNGRNKTFPGQYFHSAQDVTLPQTWYNLRHRLRLDASAESEVDVYAFGDREFWICESKWWETRPIGPAVVAAFLELGEKLKDFEERKYFEGERPFALKMWLFAHNGVTPEAEALLQAHQIYWSTRADLDALIALAGLRKLPLSPE